MSATVGDGIGCLGVCMAIAAVAGSIAWYEINATDRAAELVKEGDRLAAACLLGTPEACRNIAAKGK